MVLLPETGKSAISVRNTCNLTNGVEISIPLVGQRHNNNNNNWTLPGLICPTVMASRHNTGFIYLLARNSCLNTSMRLQCAICGRGVEFPRASARRWLTFPHGFYSAHRLSSTSFSSPTRCTGFADGPPVDGKLLMQLLYHRELLPTHLYLASWLVCPQGTFIQGNVFERPSSKQEGGICAPASASQAS